MKATRHPWRWLEPCILSFLVLTPMLVVMMGLLCITPLHAGDLPAQHLIRKPRAIAGGTPLPIADNDSRQPGPYSGPCTVHGSFGLSLDPHNYLHLFVLLPALASLVILGGSLAAWAVLTRMQTGVKPRDRMVLLRSGVLGLSWWLALSAFFILDLLGAVSLHPGFVAIYALCCILVGLLLLHPRSTGEKVLILALFMTVLVSTRFVDWNSRKPFLKDLDQVHVGMKETQADQIMAAYLKEPSPLAKVDHRGQVLSGAVNYRHTTAAWGNSEVGILTFEDRRIIGTDFLHD